MAIVLTTVNNVVCPDGKVRLFNIQNGDKGYVQVNGKSVSGRIRLRRGRAIHKYRFFPNEHGKNAHLLVNSA